MCSLFPIQIHVFFSFGRLFFFQLFPYCFRKQTEVNKNKFLTKDAFFKDLFSNIVQAVTQQKNQQLKHF